MFPEGGRTDDGWGVNSKGVPPTSQNAVGCPVIPVHIRGTRAVLAKSSSRFRPGSTEVRLGDALAPSETEDARKFAARIELAVAALADEAESDWWSARQRAAAGTTPPFRGPDVSAWRRDWALPDSARKDQRPSRSASHKPWKPNDQVCVLNRPVLEPTSCLWRSRCRLLAVSACSAFRRHFRPAERAPRS